MDCWWLLDIEGVVTCAQRNRPDVALLTVDGIEYGYKPEIWDRVRTLVDERRVRIMVMSTLGHRGALIAKEAGIPTEGTILPYVDRNEWWKLVEARRWEARYGGCIVWTDDFIKEHRPSRQWLIGRENVLGIAPSAITGLTAWGLGTIEKWLPVPEIR